MGSISHHITPLVINSLRGGHTHTHTQTHMHTFVDRSNSKKPGTRRPQACAPGLKTIQTRWTSIVVIEQTVDSKAFAIPILTARL